MEPLAIATGIALVAYFIGHRDGQRGAFAVVAEGLRRTVHMFRASGRPQQAEFAEATLRAHERFVAEVMGEATKVAKP